MEVQHLALTMLLQTSLAGVQGAVMQHLSDADQERALRLMQVRSSRKPSAAVHHDNLFAMCVMCRECPSPGSQMRLARPRQCAQRCARHSTSIPSCRGIWSPSCGPCQGYGCSPSQGIDVLCACCSKAETSHGRFS